MLWELTKLSIRRHITYRAATLAGLLTNFFFGLLRASVLVALYGTRSEVAGMTVQDAITYTGVSQATIAYLSLFSWYEIIYSVHNGQIGSDLLKPMGYFSFWMAQDLGRALVNLVLRGLVIMLFYSLVFDITVPETPGQWMALLLVSALAWLISFSYRFLINLTAFWTPNAIGIGRLFFALSWFFSGFLMPLRFLPDWFRQIFYLTPFPYTVNAIIETYLGLLSPQETVQVLVAQAVWIAVLIVAGQVTLRAGVRKLVIQGG